MCDTHYAAWRRANDVDRARAVQRRGNLKKWYGLTEADYDVMLAAQNNACAICCGNEPLGRSNKYFHVDHDHVSGVVRGLLCAKCNTAIGLLDDDVQRVARVLEYLRGGAR